MPTPGEDRMPPSEARPGLRADARRNRELLVDAAREVFGEDGVGAPLDEVARRAGVGNATMYRHFPARRDLIVAAYAEEVEALCAEGESLLGAEEPGEALFGWLSSFVSHVATKRELALAIPEDGPGRRSGLFEGWHGRMLSIAGALVVRAWGAGDVRADLSARDLLSLANGIALAETDPDRVERLLMVVRRGVGADPGPTDEVR